MSSPNPRERSSTALRFSTVTALYFAQGLPFGFFSLAVPVLLRRAGTPLDLVGLASILAIPWGLKLLWAPLVDRYFFPRFGRRKSWIVPMQLLTAATLVAIALSPVSRSSLTPLLVGFVVVSFFSATQDIATDGLSIDVFDERERGAANGIQVGAYRAGMIAGGGGILYLLSSLGFRASFLLMAGLVLSTTLPVLALRENPPTFHPPTSPGSVGIAAITGPLVSFARRGGAKELVLLLVVYKLGESLAAGMMKPFFVDRGFSDGEIALVRGLVGGVSAIVGAAVAGALMNVLGRRRALTWFAAAQTLAIAGYAAIGVAHPPHAVYVAAVIVEQAAFSAATTGLFTRMMDLCREDHRATDYTAQACIIVAATGAGMAVSGFVAKHLGYAAHFGIAALVSAFGVFVARATWPESPSSIDDAQPTGERR